MRKKNGGPQVSFHVSVRHDLSVQLLSYMLFLCAYTPCFLVCTVELYAFMVFADCSIFYHPDRLFHLFLSCFTLSDALPYLTYHFVFALIA